MLQRGFRRLADLLYPPSCLASGCRRRGAWLCAAHGAEIVGLPAEICSRCADVLTRAEGAAARPALCGACTAHPPSFERVYAVGVYRGVLRDLVLQLKYGRKRSAAPFLGRLVAERVDGAEGGFADAVVVAVPAHAHRIQRRGIDHARELAAGVAYGLGARARPECLSRVRDTRTQVGLSQSERRRNVADAFAADPGPVGGRRVILVDDVVTTGSTVRAASDALLAAGAASVVVACLARAAIVDHDR